MEDIYKLLSIPNKTLSTNNKPKAKAAVNKIQESIELLNKMLIDEDFSEEKWEEIRQGLEKNYAVVKQNSESESSSSTTEEDVEAARKKIKETLELLQKLLADGDFAQEKWEAVRQDLEKNCAIVNRNAQNQNDYNNNINADYHNYAQDLNTMNNGVFSMAMDSAQKAQNALIRAGTGVHYGPTPTYTTTYGYRRFPGDGGTGIYY